MRNTAFLCSIHEAVQRGQHLPSMLLDGPEQKKPCTRPHAVDCCHKRSQKEVLDGQTPSSILARIPTTGGGTNESASKTPDFPGK